MNLKDNVIKEIKSTLFGGALFLIGGVWVWNNIEDLGTFVWEDMQVPAYFMIGGLVLVFMKDKAITVLYDNTIGRLSSLFNKGNEPKR